MFAKSAFDYFNKQTIRKLLLVSIVVLTGLLCFSRVISERNNNAVEISLCFEEVFDLCFANNYDYVDFLKRAQAIGVTSISVNEENLASLSLSGKIVFYSLNEYKRLELLELLAPGSRIKDDTIVVLDTNLADQLTAQLSKRYSIPLNTAKAGKYRIINLNFSSPFRPVFWPENMALGFSKDKIKQITDLGFKVVLRPLNQGNPSWLAESLDKNISGVLWDGREIPGYPGKEKETKELLEISAVNIINVEFTKISGESDLKKLLPQQVVCGHTITAEELNANQNQGINLQRWTRSVKERGNRYLYFHFYRNKPIEDNIAYLRSLAKALKEQGFFLSSINPPAYPLGKFIKLRKMLVFVIAIVFPVLGLYSCFKFKNFIISYLVMNLTTLTGGLLISVLLYDLLFMQRIFLPFSVKISMLLPLLFSVFVLYSIRDIEKFFNTKLRIKHLALAGALAATLAVMLMRSGNYSLAVFPFETQIRQFMENILAIRPRTKEFLVGQPLLLLGFYFKKKYLVVLGIIGQASIINTFLHAHSPLLISTARVFNGIWLGLFIGFILLGIYEVTKNFRFETKE